MFPSIFLRLKASSSPILFPTWRRSDEMSIPKEVGVDMVLYPLTAFRAMSQSAEKIYNSIIKDGTQEALLDIMQTREELYEVLDYYNFEKQLDDKLSKN